MALLTAQISQKSPSEGPTVAHCPRFIREQVRVALIGCGAAARELHLPVLAGHAGVEISALVDRDLGRARELASAYRVPKVLTDSKDLDSSFVDGVVLCTPPFHHGPGSIELASR